MNWGWTMYLHRDDRELFCDIITTVSEKSGIDESIVEKDYYVTLILRELVERMPNIVFKGGTSLSKAHQIIERFSEDIDITFSEHIGKARRKKIKYNLMWSIGEDLGLPIDNWDNIESNKDYNHYDFTYESISKSGQNILIPYIKVETALMSYSFPTERREIKSIIYENMKKSDLKILNEYKMVPFSMNVQCLERTFIDKLFALCDYYMNNKPVRNSRHLYDIYKIFPYIILNEEFYHLVDEVRVHRNDMDIKFTPSARTTVDMVQIGKEIVDSNFYRRDYENSTRKLINEDVSYAEVIQCYNRIMNDVFFKSENV